MMGVAYKLSMDIDDYPGSGSKVRRCPPGRSTPVDTTIQQQLVPTVEPTTLSSIEALLQSAFVEISANEVHDKTAASSEKLAKSWLVRAQDRVARLSREPTRTPPNSAVAESVRTLLSLLYLVDMKPSRIVATADGGMSLWFLRERYKAQLEISNDCPHIAVFAETASGSDPKISEVSLLRSHKELIPALMKIWVSRLA